ncbi:hypothetical protein [Pseudomonas fluorescens]|uniref:Uncharacterized protein n=1 Tax=Pseudomonas fluorescens TaxID=294 RepID=A0A944HBV4_PSEFL|nr:hypothetical protein [Pseudomonas fluorescens]MBT2298399.1 hypothetical protein [Pseudomonas fluorescens]MBT2309925.1 hypothetical protein [Pseudomonas fluorescens]MBT2310948.1 hypothetical protein [Pseudomonas fluorescens]MBT2320117.1 hypothetical protein [Pseudomonas fluorescens]MBT2328855.1 hypothetical protein [Pseudomonas fluorescens]
MNADFHLKEEVVAQYKFLENRHPSGGDASSVNCFSNLNRLWGKLSGAGGQLKLGMFFVFRTHCLKDAVGIFLGRSAKPLKAKGSAAFERMPKRSGRTPQLMFQIITTSKA